MRLLPPVPIASDAEFSDDGKRRYWLTRSVGDSGPVGLMCALNPSKAGAIDTDHTVTKWCGFAERWGWRGFVAVNLFSHIETKSALLRNLTYEQAVGPDNDRVIAAIADHVYDIVLCWGAGVPRHLQRRTTEVITLLGATAPHAKVQCFGLSADGSPLHPLRLGYDTPLVPYVRFEDAKRPRALRREHDE